MREDMFKVIVERPRHGRYLKSEYPCPRDLEESPNHEGLRKRHRNRKSLNENLRPLERFLGKQINRPWDKVFSELCKGIDRRNTVQKHIHQHIDDFVVRKVVKIEGELYSLESWGGYRPLLHRWQSKLYVDPDNGILRKNIFREKARARDRREGLEAKNRLGLYRRVLDGNHQLLRLEGLWYFVTVAPVPTKPDGGQPICLDVIRKQAAWDFPCNCSWKVTCRNQKLLGNCKLYAVAKRQLNTRELTRYGVHNN